MSDPTGRRLARNAMRRVSRARRFPENTDSSSRHVEIMADVLLSGRPYPMFAEDPEHCAGSLLSVVESLYKARNEIERLRAALSEGKEG
jgi:hypothetical protein